jgi:group I intron endonuclease
MIIYSALLKNGYSVFKLEILEYCPPKDMLAREQYYLDLVKPKYNILTKAGSSLGFKHSEETKQKMRDAQKEIDHSGRFKKGHKHTEEIKTKMREAQKEIDHSGRFKKGHEHSEETKNKIRETLTKLSQKIEVLDLETGTQTTYSSMGEAARSLGIRQHTITMYFTRNSQKPCKGRYVFTKQ